MRSRLLGLVLVAVHMSGAYAAHAEGAADREPESLAPLELEEVLRSVDAFYPLLLAAEAERGAVAGRLDSARGSFDTRLTAEGDLRPAGFYESYSGGATLEQPTRLWGTRFFAGYRIGRGDYAAYEGGRQTDDSGEVRGGFEIPLLRGGAIDEPRARLQQADLDLRRIDPEIQLQRIEFRRQASLAYWGWLASQRGVGVEARLLEVAEARQGQIEGRVSRGALPRIDLTDNERLIVDRQIRLRGAERDAQQAAIDLSLFLRDDAGDPIIVDSERMPAEFPTEDEPSRERLARDVERAGSDHPLLKALDLEVERAEVELELARNDRLPAVDFLLEGSRDTGSSDPGISSEGTISSAPRGDTEVRALVRFELPIQRREADGRAQAVRAKLRRLENHLRFAGDRIVADIRRAMEGLEAAFVQTQAARRNLELAQQLRRAEERKLMLGTSNLIDVNIREIQAAEAARALIEAQAEYFRALAVYRAAVAVES